MKTILIAAAATAATLAAAPAMAAPPSYPTYTGVTAYGNLGYSNAVVDGGDYSAITGRIGARYGEYFGLEGELSGGLNNSRVGGAGGRSDASMNDEVAIYGVGYLPVTRNIDLLARVGYGATNFHGSEAGTALHGVDQSWNFGAGGQYFFDQSNGVRLDYTYYDYNAQTVPNANVVSVAYVHKF